MSEVEALMKIADAIRILSNNVAVTGIVLILVLIFKDMRK